MARHELQVGKAFHRRRLDEFLFNSFTSLSKAYLRQVLKTGGCELNGEHANGGLLVREDDFIEIEIDERMSTGMVPEEMPIKVLFEDDKLLVIDKPAGFLVHPTHFERNGTMLNAMTFYLNRGREEGDVFVRPHLVHRLDRETSGVLVSAKDQRSSRILCSHFKRGHFEKTYIAVVDGVLKDDEGSIDLPIARSAEQKRWEVTQGGKPSVTRYSVVERKDSSTIVRLEPVTGRTNQLRIHMAAIGHPITGDKTQGGADFPRLCLHCSSMSFWHPDGGERVTVESRPDFL